MDQAISERRDTFCIFYHADGKAAKKTPDIPTAEAMPKADVSRMLSMLKYNAKPGSKTTDETKAKYERALSVYKGLDKAQKHEFLKKFQINKKDIDWVEEFVESHEMVKSVCSGVKRGYFNCHEILKVTA